MSKLQSLSQDKTKRKCHLDEGVFMHLKDIIFLFSPKLTQIQEHLRAINYAKQSHVVPPVERLDLKNVLYC